MIIIRIINSGCHPTPKRKSCHGCLRPGCGEWVLRSSSSLTGLLVVLNYYAFTRGGFFHQTSASPRSLDTQSLEVFLPGVLKWHLVEKMRHHNNFWKIIILAHVYCVIGTVLSALDILLKTTFRGAEIFTITTLWIRKPGLLTLALAQGHVATEKQSPCSWSLAVMPPKEHWLGWKRPGQEVLLGVGEDSVRKARRW